MKKNLCFLIVAMSVFFLVACGGNKTTTLRFMETMTSTDRTELLKKLIADYESANPGIKVELISPPYEQSETRALMAFSAKQPLDVIEVRDVTASHYLGNKWLEDLSSRVVTLPDWESVLSTGKELAKGTDGNTYMIPLFFFVPTLFLRTDVLSKLGVSEYPQTIEELYDICKRITNPANNQFGWTVRGKNYPYRHGDFIIISSVPNINRANLYQLNDGSSIFDSPDYLASFSAFVDLFKNASPPDGVNWGFNEQITSFASGITPYLVQDSDAIPAIKAHLEDSQFMTIPMPVGSTGTFVYGPGFASFAIPSHSKNKDAAWDFIAYLSSPEINAQICRVYGSLPVHSVTYENDPFFSSGHYAAFAAILSDPTKYVTVGYPYDSPQFPGWAQVHEQYLQSTFLGQTTPEEAVKAFADYWR